VLTVAAGSGRGARAGGGRAGASIHALAAVHSSLLTHGPFCGAWDPPSSTRSHWLPRADPNSRPRPCRSAATATTTTTRATTPTTTRAEPQRAPSRPRSASRHPRQRPRASAPSGPETRTTTSTTTTTRPTRTTAPPRARRESSATMCVLSHPLGSAYSLVRASGPPPDPLSNLLLVLPRPLAGEEALHPGLCPLRPLQRVAQTRPQARGHRQERSVLVLRLALLDSHARLAASARLLRELDVADPSTSLLGSPDRRPLAALQRAPAQGPEGAQGRPRHGAARASPSRDRLGQVCVLLSLSLNSSHCAAQSTET